METRVHLATIPFVDEAFWDFGTFGLVALHLFSAGMRHLLAVLDLLCLIEMLKELHTKVQGMISSPHIATTLIYNVLRSWRLHLNICVAALASETLEAPEANVLFSLEPIQPHKC